MNTESFIKDFLKKNWFILWFILVLVIIINVMVYFNFKSTTENMEKELKNISKSVIMLSPTGTLMLQKRVIITEDNKAFQEAVKKILVNHLIISGSEATKGFTKLPQSPKELVKIYPPFQEFFENYLSTNAKYIFRNYLVKILQLLRQDNYPDFINILNSEITSYFLTKDGFNITVTTNVIMSYSLPEQNLKNVKVKGTIVINATGYFDPMKGTISNPLGVVFTGFKITIPTKRTDNAF